MTRKILIGCASWSDPGFIADWYPPKLAKTKLLSWYAEHFNFVEVNSSFYAIPAQKSMANWAEQTPSDFTFDIKLHKLLSRHSTKLKEVPTDLRSVAAGTEEKVLITPRLEQLMVEQILEATEPLQDSGKLGAFLLQMTPGFSPKMNRMEELEPIAHMLKGFKLALELRNRNWLTGDNTLDVVKFCEKNKISLVMVDVPLESKHWMVMPDFQAVTDPRMAYFRLHGRDEKAFTTGKTVAERFNYEYSQDELQGFAEKVGAVAEEAAEIHVVFNNNASNLAPKAAEAFQKIIDEHISKTPS